MKRCPKCNQTFEEDWLSFCTQDGATLVDTSALPSGPPPTVLSSSMPPSISPNDQPTINLGSHSQQTPPASYVPPQPMQSGWQPPPPPSYVNKPQQGLAMTSMILGLVSVTIGWCCSIGLLTA